MRHKEILELVRHCLDPDRVCTNTQHCPFWVEDNTPEDNTFWCVDRLFAACADALEELIRENDRLKNTITIPKDDTTCYGYPVRELLAFALLCRREGIEEKDLHDYCMGVENGFMAGWHDFEITQKNMLQRMMSRITSDVKVFSIDGPPLIGHKDPPGELGDPGVWPEEKE